MGKNTKRKTYFDYNLLVIVIFLLCLGLLMIYSASYYAGDTPIFYLRKQIVSSLLGLVVMFGLIFFPYKILDNIVIAVMAYVGAIALILLIIPFGIEKNGAKRWLHLGISIQPSEIAKFCLILCLAHFISVMGQRLKYWIPFLIGIGLVVAVTLLIAVVTKNLSSGLIIAAIGIMMIFIAAPRVIYFLPLAIVGVLGIVALISMEGYRMTRVQVWLHPEQYMDGDGYQTMQALYAIGSGGLFGKGLGNGSQKFYIPEVHNDMIYAVICEELGLVGGIIVMLMFVYMIWRFMVIANNAKDLFGTMLVTGVMIHIAIQVFMNIAVVTNTMPNTGVTLPFVSYGGSSMVVLLAEIGLVLSVSRRIQTE